MFAKCITEVKFAAICIIAALILTIGYLIYAFVFWVLIKHIFIKQDMTEVIMSCYFYIKGWIW